MTSPASSLPSRVVLLCGPPCAGKTTEAQRLAQLGDLVVDFDAMARELGSPVRWLHPEPYRTRAELWVRDLLVKLPGQGGGTAWVIRSLPRPQQRAIAARLARAAEVRVIDPGMDECLRRATVDSRPDGTEAEIRSWYARYEPWSGDNRPTGM